MLGSTKRNIAIVAATAIIATGSAGASAVLESDNPDMQISEIAMAEEQSANAESVQFPDIQESGITAYVSSTGKIHTKPDCSGMKNSTAMDISQAKAAGYQPCKRCN